MILVLDFYTLRVFKISNSNEWPLFEISVPNIFEKTDFSHIFGCALIRFDEMHGSQLERFHIHKDFFK